MTTPGLAPQIKNKSEAQTLKRIKVWALGNDRKTKEELELAAKTVDRIREIWVYVAGFAAAVAAITFGAAVADSSVVSDGLWFFVSAIALIVGAWGLSTVQVVRCLRLLNVLDATTADADDSIPRFRFPWN